MQSPLKTVLVVDDSEEIRWALKTYLQLEGFQVLTAGNGQEALEVLKAQSGIHFIVLDLTMPIMTGAEFLQHRARSTEWSQIPVAICSGDLNLSVKEDVVAQLSKPFDTRELVSLIHAHCS